MKYIYDISLNFNNNLYNFYEWDVEDKIVKYKKIPLFKISSDLFDLVVNKKIMVTNEFLNSININNEHICVFSTLYDSIATEFNNDGTIGNLSKLQLNDEEYLLDTLHKVKNDVIDYVKCDGKNNYSLNTRKEKQIIDEITEYILNNKNNIKEIEFLFFDLYSIKSSNYQELIKKIKNENKEKLDYIYKTIKILKINA